MNYELGIADSEDPHNPAMSIICSTSCLPAEALGAQAGATCRGEAPEAEPDAVHNSITNYELRIRN